MYIIAYYKSFMENRRMDINIFIKKNRKKSSIFDQYKEEIFELIKNEISQENIIIFLKKKKRKKQAGLTQPNLSQWLKRQKGNSQKLFFQDSKPQDIIKRGSDKNNQNSSSFRTVVTNSRIKNCTK